MLFSVISENSFPLFAVPIYRFYIIFKATVRIFQNVKLIWQILVFFASNTPLRHISSCKLLCKSEHFFSNYMLSLSNFCKLKFNCFTFSNSSEDIAILCTLLSKAIRFLPVNFLFDNSLSLWILAEMIVIGNLKYLYTRIKNQIVPNKYLLLWEQAILLHFRSSINRPLNRPQYPGSNNYFNIPEENI